MVSIGTLSLVMMLTILMPVDILIVAMTAFQKFLLVLESAKNLRFRSMCVFGRYVCTKQAFTNMCERGPKYNRKTVSMGVSHLLPFFSFSFIYFMPVCMECISAQGAYDVTWHAFGSFGDIIQLS